MGDIFQYIESEVRLHCRNFNYVFISAKDSTIVRASSERLVKLRNLYERHDIFLTCDDI